MEGISAYFAALRGTEEDFARIQGCLERISQEQANNDIEAESAEVMQFFDRFDRGRAQRGFVAHCSKLSTFA